MDTERLKLFITEFIPPGRMGRKSDRQHIGYILGVVNKIFRKYYGKEKKFHSETLISCFNQLDFRINEEKNQKWQSGSGQVELKREVWINVSIKDLLLLRLTLGKLPTNLSDIKRKEVNEIIDRIRVFNFVQVQ